MTKARTMGLVAVAALGVACAGGATTTSSAAGTLIALDDGFVANVRHTDAGETDVALTRHGAEVARCFLRGSNGRGSGTIHLQGNTEQFAFRALLTESAAASLTLQRYRQAANLNASGDVGSSTQNLCEWTDAFGGMDYVCDMQCDDNICSASCHSGDCAYQL